MFLSCFAQKPECLEEARKQYERWKQSPNPSKDNPIPADYQTTFIAFGIVLNNGTKDEKDKEFKFLIAATAGTEKGNPLEIEFYATRLREARQAANDFIWSRPGTGLRSHSVPFRWIMTQALSL